jgi:hypothetical protein
MDRREVSAKSVGKALTAPPKVRQPLLASSPLLA